MPEHMIGTIRGAKGLKGDPGNTGPRGLVGPAGAAGIKGITGDIGMKGLRGDQGPAGPKGPPGTVADVTLVGLGGVPTSRKVNGKKLSSDIVLAPTDVGVVPTSRRVNGHPLTGDVVLTTTDLQADFNLESHRLELTPGKGLGQLTCTVINQLAVVYGVICSTSLSGEQTIAKLPYPVASDYNERIVTAIGNDKYMARIWISFDELKLSYDSDKPYFIPIAFVYLIEN